MRAALGVLVSSVAHAGERTCDGAQPIGEKAREAAPELSVPEPAYAGVLAGPGFGFMLDGAGLGELACAPTRIARAALRQAALDAEAALSVDAQLVVVLSTAPLTCSSLYYVPLANDVRGIGYAHTSGQDVFDDTPEHRLEGVAFLNDFPYWRAHPGELESAFAHEVGHRWGARVHARVQGQASARLLGRDREHWSYFFSSGGSPLEGNVWVAAPAGYASDTPRYPNRFSMLDLYLMGAASPAEVPPTWLLQEPHASATDCLGRVPTPSSPPQTCGAGAVQASPIDVSIEDIIAIEGPRDPAPAAVAPDVEVLALVLHSSDSTWSVADCEDAARTLDERIDGFATATGGRLRLTNALARGGTSCEALSQLSDARTPMAAASTSSAPTCTLRSESASPPWGFVIGALLLLAGAVRRQRRSS